MIRRYCIFYYSLLKEQEVWFCYEFYVHGCLSSLLVNILKKFWNSSCNYIICQCNVHVHVPHEHEVRVPYEHEPHEINLITELHVFPTTEKRLILFIHNNFLFNVTKFFWPNVLIEYCFISLNNGRNKLYSMSLCVSMSVCASHKTM